MRVNYKKYTKSETWRKKATIVKEIAAYKCQLCGKKGKLNVHHNTYDNLGNEPLCDLVCLCESCHEAFHNDIDFNTSRDGFKNFLCRALLRNNYNDRFRVLSNAGMLMNALYQSSILESSDDLTYETVELIKTLFLKMFVNMHLYDFLNENESIEDSRNRWNDLFDEGLRRKLSTYNYG